MCRLLLVSLAIDAILEQVTIGRRRQKLCAIIRGEGLDDAYAPTLERVKAQEGSKSKLGMEALMWVSHSERPLHVNELCHALGIERGSTDLNTRNVPAIETILGCTLGFITVEEPTSTVYLVHSTLQEHLSYNLTLFHSPHSMIAEACLTYLNFREIKDLSPALPSAPPTAPFIEYASYYWGAHARREATESVMPLALRLLDGYDKHIASKLLLLHDKDGPGQSFSREDDPTGFTGLHGVACLGVVEILTVLLKLKEWDLNATDFGGSTALAWAAGKGRDEVLKVLLKQRDINPNTANKYGQTPLSWAAKGGHERVVKLLSERGDVNPDSPGSDSRTPLLWAAHEGHDRVVKLLLRYDNVTPDTLDSEDRTPLSWAAHEGHEGVVKLLLKRSDVNPDYPDIASRTPLSWAAYRGHEAVVKLLLERESVNPDHSDKLGRTPLSWAAHGGHVGVVKLLLEQETVNPDRSDKSGRTPLLWATHEGHERVVNLLSGRGDVNPVFSDDGGPTPDQPPVYSHPEHVPGPTNLPTQLPIPVSSIAGRQDLARLEPAWSGLVEGGDTISLPLPGGPIPRSDNRSKERLPASAHQKVSKKSATMVTNQESAPGSPEVHEKSPLPTIESQKPAELLLPLSESPATHLIDCCLRAFSVDRHPTQSRYLGRFRLWANEYGTPYGQLDKILKESPIIREATITLLADLCSILDTRTAHFDGNYSILLFKVYIL